MSPETLISIVAGIVVPVVVPVAAMLWKLNGTVSALKVQMDVLWNHTFRKGVAAGVANESIAINSPLRVTDKGDAMFAPIKADLIKWYETVNKKMLDADLLALIEKEWGKRINTEVCIPNKIADSQCIVIALALCRGEVPMP